MSGAAVVLQARMGSARLPGKVLATVGGRSMLAQAVDRLRGASGLPVVLATTLGPEDDVLVSAAEYARLTSGKAGAKPTDFVHHLLSAPKGDFPMPRRMKTKLRRVDLG